MIEKSIFDMLSNDAGITALVSTKIYPMVLPQNYQTPAIVYRNNGIEKRSNYDTISEAFTQTNITIDAISDTYSEVKAVSQAVFDALHNYRGTQSGNVIYSIEQDSYLELYDDGIDVYRSSRIFLINHVD